MRWPVGTNVLVTAGSRTASAHPVSAASAIHPARVIERDVNRARSRIPDGGLL
jgi:hypothetical protein